MMVCHDSIEAHSLLSTIVAQTKKPRRGIAVACCSAEGRQILHEIHVQPLQARLACGFRRLSVKGHPDPSASKVGMHSRVQDEPVNPAIPSHVDKAHQPRLMEGCDIDKAVLKDGLEIRLLVRGLIALEESIEFVVGEGRFAAIVDIVHLPNILLAPVH